MGDKLSTGSILRNPLTGGVNVLTNPMSDAYNGFAKKIVDFQRKKGILYK